MSTILEIMTDQYNSFTKSGRKLADYIFARPSEAAYLSISSLAEKSGVSEATITRFCRQLHLAGYHDFKLALAKADRSGDPADPTSGQALLNSGESLESMFQKIHGLHTNALTETLERLDSASFHAAATILSASDHVYCFGNGGSMVMAMEAWARFSTVTSKFVHISDSHMQVITTALAGPSDSILFFSYSGSTRDMEEVLTLARERHASVILVTHFPNSPAARMADVVLLCGYNESPLQSGSIAAKIGQMFVIECLYYTFCRRSPEATAQARELTAQAIARKLL